jgi:hypothetical protein
MSVTDGLIEEELHKIVATGEDGASVRDDDALIAEASRRARGRAGLMVDNAPSAAETEHWEGVLGEIRDEGHASERERSAIEDGVRAQLIP